MMRIAVLAILVALFAATACSANRSLKDEMPTEMTPIVPEHIEIPVEVPDMPHPEIPEEHPKWPEWPHPDDDEEEEEEEEEHEKIPIEIVVEKVEIEKIEKCSGAVAACCGQPIEVYEVEVAKKSHCHDCETTIVTKAVSEQVCVYVETLETVKPKKVCDEHHVCHVIVEKQTIEEEAEAILVAEKYPQEVIWAYGEHEQCYCDAHNIEEVVVEAKVEKKVEAQKVAVDLSTIIKHG